MVLGVCSYHFILLDQCYVQGIFGVSHGALQFMAYEEMKKGYSQYFGTRINKKLVNTICTCLYSEGRVGKVRGFSSQVVIIFDELQHFGGTTDAKQPPS